jgi:hypothetical protein
MDFIKKLVSRVIPVFAWGREIVIYKDSSNRWSLSLWERGKSAGQIREVILFPCG